MSHFNHLSSILNHNKLECPNYVDRKRNLNIVLTFEGFKYVLLKNAPLNKQMQLMRRLRSMRNGSRLMRWQGGDDPTESIGQFSPKTPPSVAYIVGKPVASSSKSAKAQKKKKKSCKVVAPGGATGGVVSQRASATTPSSMVTTRGNCPDYQAKMKNRGNAAAK
ncbi:hypothetical protein KY285_023713 [Solanum tuberosum]|nr:hypothetical protein KY289_024040 [Solanum tuberosum]KAH0675912.1 hypothetical protein KY285_023713 [Solanum tuberosum]